VGAAAWPTHRSLVFFVGVNVLRRQQQQQHSNSNSTSSAAAATPAALPCKLCRLLCCRSVAVVTVTAFGFCPHPRRRNISPLSLSFSFALLHHRFDRLVSFSTVSKFVVAAREFFISTVRLFIFIFFSAFSLRFVYM